MANRDGRPDGSCLLGGEELELDGAARRPCERGDLGVEPVRSGRPLTDAGETFQASLKQAYRSVVTIHHDRVLSLHVTLLPPGRLADASDGTLGL